ncbi:MAG: carboxypeptidase-like regulatory domain-containing protein, partial [Bacteroidota bacterium]
MARLLPLLALAALLAPASAQPLRLEATVVDAETGDPLPGATAQIEGTTQGDAADADGRLTLPLDALPTEVIVRFVGYAPARLSLRPSDVEAGVIRRTVGLSIAPYILGEVAVSAEPPGERIWRRVLARKRVLMGAMGGYSAEAYTRMLHLRDGWLDVRPVPIRLTEQLSTVAWRPVVGAREEVVARRRRPDGGPFRWADTGPIPDVLFEDWLWLDGRRVMGPGHPDAISAYAFRLGETVERDGMRFLELAVIPRRQGLLAGRIRVVDSLFVVAEANLRAPFGPSGSSVQGFDAEHHWEYESIWGGTRLRDSLWLPTVYRREGTLDAGVPGYDIPPVRFRQLSLIGPHRLGARGSDLTIRTRYRNPRAVYAGTDVYRLPRSLVPLDSLEALADSSRRLENARLRDLLKPQEGLTFTMFGIPVVSS